ncbi:MAG: YHS domain-containing protein [Gammaproteobacteria bacterium]|nr:MAG: YHS domain-containing protein [Gammaproteobacteria bacterium]TND04378.1 MAG: YHS domain-containing protein [Gammaproteobacteria bacterium]
MKPHNQPRCPVCDMEVTHEHYTTVYQQMNFVFCSAQCRDNFTAHPHLYIGMHGQKAPRQEGEEAIKRRRIHLARSPDAAEETGLRDALSRLMGIKDVVFERDCIAIFYDLLQVTEAQIETALVDAGARLGSGWSERLRRGWVHYAEETQLESMEVTPSTCCNRPPTGR